MYVLYSFLQVMSAYGNCKPIQSQVSHLYFRISISFLKFDTCLVPTDDMYRYASKASLGDDVYEELTTALFEEHVARISGKEAALFLPSGTMSNQIALRTHLTQPPYSVLCDYRAHINKSVNSELWLSRAYTSNQRPCSRYEAGGTAFHSGASLTTVIPRNGRFNFALR